MIAPPGIVYPPAHELNVTVMVSISSGLIISNTTFQVSQNYAFFHLRNDANFTLTVNSNHDDAGSSAPETIQLISMYQNNTAIANNRFISSYIQHQVTLWTPVEFFKTMK